MPIALQSSDPDDRESERFVKKTLGAIISYEKKLQALAVYFKMPKLKAHLGTISAQIIQSDPKPQTDILTRLPRELGAEVWKNLKDPADRLMLALTCKFNAGMFEELKGVRGQPMVKKNAGNAKATAKPQGVQKRARYHTSDKGTKTETMAILRRLQTWMGHNRDLCYTCMQYVSKTATTDIRGFTEKGGWGGRSFPPADLEGQKRTTLKTLEIQGRRCPVCVVWKHVEYKKDTLAFKETVSKLERIVE